MTISARPDLRTLIFIILLIAANGSLLFANFRPVDSASSIPIRSWAGERFIFLPEAPYGQRRADGYEGFARGTLGPSPWTSVPPYEELAGKSACIIKVRDLGDRLLVILREEESGRFYSTFVMPRLLFGTTILFDYEARGIPGIAPVSDLEEAKHRYLGRIFRLKRDAIRTIDPVSGGVGDLVLGKGAALKVVDVRPGWHRACPVRLVLETLEGLRGFIDVHVSGVNVPEEIRTVDKLSDTLEPVSYGRLEILSVRERNDRLVVDGVTDLPEHARVIVTCGRWRPASASISGLSPSAVSVSRHRFRALFSVGKGAGNPCIVEASFNPARQPSSVRWLVGERGERLISSSLVYLPDGRSILVREKNLPSSLCALASDLSGEVSSRRGAYLETLRSLFSEKGIEADFYIHGKFKTHFGIVLDESVSILKALRLISGKDLRSLGFFDLSINRGKSEAVTLPLMFHDPIQTLSCAAYGR